MIEPGTKNGEMRRTPRAFSSSRICSMSGRPPIPEPMITPMRSAFASLTSRPLSRSACMPAAMP